MTPKAPWFGRLLDWRWDPQREMHAAYHGGRTHFITKVDRQTADAQGGGMSRGWHIWDDNDEHDENRWDGFGPGLGTRVARAKRLAEAWIICPYADMMGYPGLKTTLTLATGAVWENGRTIRPNDECRRFEVHDRDGTVLFAIVPVFLGTGGATSIRWRACTPIEQIIAGSDTWDGAIRALARADAKGLA